MNNRNTTALESLLPPSVDFLVLTTLEDETQAVKARLDLEEDRHPYYSGTITSDGGRKYDVLLAEIGEQGNDKSGPFTANLLNHVAPSFVILTGICGGVPESGVKLGDVLVPRSIVDYELAKLGPDGADPRGDPARTDLRLWRVACGIATHERARWPATIQQRPEDSEGIPEVRCHGVIGSGNKVVADERADVRRWLRDTYKKRALGFEMEAVGVANACEAVRTLPCLVIKGVQDRSDSTKDALGEKDLWRRYACDAAAALTARVISKTVVAEPISVEHYRATVGSVVRRFGKAAPLPPFQFTANTAETYDRLRAGALRSENEGIDSLIPSDVTPLVALYGGGGAGKSTILRRLFSGIHAQVRSPVLIDLTEYKKRAASGKRSKQRRRRADGRGPGLVERVLEASMPRLSKRQLEGVARRTGRLVLLLDGLNEVSREARNAILNYCLQLHRGMRAHVLVTDRFGSGEGLEAFLATAVNLLPANIVEAQYDEKFGRGTFGELDESARHIHRIPFFLALALQLGHSSEGATTESRMLERFLTERCGVTSAHIDRSAKATLGASDRESLNVDLPLFRKTAGRSLAGRLQRDGILSSAGSRFEHHLWRDYFFARGFARLGHRTWTDDRFDTATMIGASRESLSMTTEQLKGAGIVDRFIKKVYDWNYFAAADCIVDLPSDGTVGPSRPVRLAILALLAEKRFDRVERTRERAESSLRRHQDGLGRAFLQVGSPQELLEYVRESDERGEWFTLWKGVFTKEGGNVLLGKEVNLIEDEDSILGWTVANVIRRTAPSVAVKGNLIRLYKRWSRSRHRRSVRWRIVHALGRYPEGDAVSLLIHAFEHDAYDWARYGAVRSLTEIAAGNAGFRPQLGTVIDRYVRSGGNGKRISICREIVEASLIEGASEGWKDFMGPILSRVAASEAGTAQGDTLARRVAEFRGDGVERKGARSVGIASQ
jgi:nucleoside phosphorylase